MADFSIHRREGRKEEDYCPLLEQPDGDCYCMDMNSLVLPAAIKYCLGNFRACPVRIRLLDDLKK